MTSPKACHTIFIGGMIVRQAQKASGYEPVKLLTSSVGYIFKLVKSHDQETNKNSTCFISGEQGRAPVFSAIFDVISPSVLL